MTCTTYSIHEHAEVKAAFQYGDAPLTVYVHPNNPDDYLISLEDLDLALHNNTRCNPSLLRGRTHAEHLRNYPKLQGGRTLNCWYADCSGVQEILSDALVPVRRKDALLLLQVIQEHLDLGEHTEPAILRYSSPRPQSSASSSQELSTAHDTIRILSSLNENLTSDHIQALQKNRRLTEELEEVRQELKEEKELKKAYYEAKRSLELDQIALFQAGEVAYRHAQRSEFNYKQQKKKLIPFLDELQQALDTQDLPRARLVIENLRSQTCY